MEISISKKDIETSLKVLKELFKEIDLQTSAPSENFLENIGYSINHLEILEEYSNLQEYIKDFEIHGDYIEDLFMEKEFHPRKSLNEEE